MIRYFKDELLHQIQGAHFSFLKKSAKRNLPFCMPGFSSASGGPFPPFLTPRGPAHPLERNCHSIWGFAGQAPPLHVKFGCRGRMAGKKAAPGPALFKMIRIFTDELLHQIRGAHFSIKKKSAKRNSIYFGPRPNPIEALFRS
jgi:hypothetical protein